MATEPGRVYGTMPKPRGQNALVSGIVIVKAGGYARNLRIVRKKTIKP